ncbi:hypothetical protein ACH5RR_003612 [Cinchona calisaya]|uniref:Ubiquitin-like domain-containing protein n=1 Tax=Cinchona calisaya TaxID=153742 RepID=A0ABD3AVB4_9GENT
MEFIGVEVCDEESFLKFQGWEKDRLLKHLIEDHIARVRVNFFGTSSVSESMIVSLEMYIRVKRNKTTYFLQCLPSEKVLQIKEKLQILIDQPANDQRLILIKYGEVLDDSKSLADQKVENDAALALTLRKDDNEFEDVNVVRPNDYNL